jgi:hypothetical protein
MSNLIPLPSKSPDPKVKIGGLATPSIGFKKRNQLFSDRNEAYNPVSYTNRLFHRLMESGLLNKS